MILKFDLASIFEPQKTPSGRHRTRRLLNLSIVELVDKILVLTSTRKTGQRLPKGIRTVG